MKNFWLFQVAIAAAVMSLFVATARTAADVTTIGASQDTSIFGNNVNNSAGGAIVMFAGTDGNSSVKRALVAFDVANNIPAGSTITAVQLTLSLGQVAGNATMGTATIGLHRLGATWGEGITGTGLSIAADGQGFAGNNGDATWANRFFSSTSPTAWTNPGGDFATGASASTTVGATLNVGYTWLSTPALVSDVQGWLDSASTNAGWLLQNNDELSVKTFRAFYTREATDSTLRPQLQITYTAVPESGALSLIALAGLGLAGRRHRK